MATEVPTTTSFEDIYPTEALSRQKRRWNNLLSTFQKQYGKKADFVSRSPGRVNIIGEAWFIPPPLLFHPETDCILFVSQTAH